MTPEETDIDRDPVGFEPSRPPVPYWAIGSVVLLLVAGLAAGGLTMVGRLAPALTTAQYGCLDQPGGDHDETIAACTRVIATPGVPPPVLAHAYTMRGEAYCNKRQYDLAIADQDRSIAAVADNPVAYRDRGMCHQEKEELRQALADYSKAIDLAPNFDVARYDRSQLYHWLGESDAAVADMSRTIELSPGNIEPTYERGRIFFDFGQFAQSIPDFKARIAAPPKNPYAVLWLHVARVRAHMDDAAEFRANMKSLDLSTWPGPLFDLYLGKTSLDRLDEISGGPDSKDPANDRCQYLIFGGEYALIHDDREKAKALFSEGSGACQSVPLAMFTDRFELTRLIPGVAAEQEALRRQADPS